jgi:6-pyruvoyltetrahydropterin/6-carboxytetrahydropterin synthase
MEIYKEFMFDAAHFLPNVPPGHKCRNIHGHTYHVIITIDGTIKKYEGWLCDFADIKKAFEPILKQLDHQLLNDIPGLENPTAEILAIWIWKALKPMLPELSIIEIKETPTSGIRYRG